MNLFCSRFVFALILGMAVASSTVNAESVPSPDDLTISIATSDVLRARYNEKDVLIQFSGHQVDDQTIRLEFNVNKKPIKILLDLFDESMRIDGSNAVLESNEKLALSHASSLLHDSILARFGELNDHTLMLVQMMAYLAQAPTDHPIKDREIRAEYDGYQ